MEEATVFTLGRPAYILLAEEVERLLDTNCVSGLSKQEAKRRHEIVGDNALEGGHHVSIWKVLIRQCANALTLVCSLMARANARFLSWPCPYPTAQAIILKAVSSLLSSSVCPTSRPGSNFSKHFHWLYSRISGRKDHGFTSSIVISNRCRPTRF